MFSFVFEPDPSDRLATRNQEKARFVLLDLIYSIKEWLFCQLILSSNKPSKLSLFFFKFTFTNYPYRQNSHEPCTKLNAQFINYFYFNNLHCLFSRR